MRQKTVGFLGLMALACFLTTCGNQPQGKVSYPNIKSARAITTHYVLIEFDNPANALADDAANYLIVDPQKAQLPVSAVSLSVDRTEALVATAEQAEVQYQVAVGDADEFHSLGRILPIGALGFLGTSVREPFLESAISLSSTQILLTFSQQMDRETAETIEYYEIADPDGNTDVDIRITAADLQLDFTTVLLTTTPQANTEYQIRVTNVKRRFSCEDEGRIFLDSASQNTTCSASFRPRDSDGVLSSFALTARTQINRNAPTDPNATGIGGAVGLEANGAGVRRPLCNGGTTGIEGTNGSDSDEELIITADRPELMENIVLGVRGMDFVVDMPVLFISSDASSGFDYVINTTEVRTALNAGTTAGDLVFDNMPTLPDGLRIDAIKLRETNGEIWLHSVCGLATNRRLIDPTRNTALFFGIPPVDTTGPQVVRAESISNTEVVVSFSEPLDDQAANPLNFSIDPPLAVIDARPSKFDTQVILTTSPQLANVVYTVTVENVKDKAGNLIDPDANSATFSYIGGPDGLGAEVLPRVAGAASTGNMGVMVTFTKPMGDSALMPSNYYIVQTNVNPEVGALLVFSAEFITPQRDAVQLTTASQSEVTYLLRAINVRDLFGNQIAPPQLLVDPATATFPGTPFTCGDEPCEEPDQDGDGLSDHDELRGYVVTVELQNGQQVTREVTSDIFNPDTDADGLTDADEKRLVSDPRRADTDDDQISDYVEYNFIYSDQNDQDTDDDGIDDILEIDFSKTNATIADSDGDGFDDGEELFVMNRDPRIADLPRPGMAISTVDLHLQEQFTYVTQDGVTHTEDSSTSSSLAASSSQTVSTSIETSLGLNIKGTFEAGIEGPPIKVHAKGGVEAGLSFGLTFQSSRQSTEETNTAFEHSMSKGFSITGTNSYTREVSGGRIDALVTLNNLSDVAFKLSNLEITVSAPDPVDRTQFLPVATLIPNSTLITGEPAEYNLGVLDDSGRGPIMFSSRDVFPALVEDLMRDPRGLLFQFANYSLSDEHDRNFAFASQAARDRTVGLVIDYGDGVPVRHLVAYAPVRFEQASCDPETNPGCDIVGGFAGFSDANIPPYGGVGPVPGLPLEYILETVLQMRRSQAVITPIWLTQPSLVPETSEGDPVDPDGILVGPDGVSDSIAQGDDVQLIPFGIDGLPEDAVVINAGNDGVLDSIVQPGDAEGIITGYSTSKSCGPGTPSSIRTGPNGLVDTIRDPFSDDVQLQPFGTVQNLDADIIGPGANGFIDTAPAGDDVFVGPGIPCDDDDDCVAPGVCDGQELLFRLEHRSRGQFGRIWAVLVPNANLIGLDFRKVVLRPGQALNLSFIQDLDRDGLISDIEFLFGSADTKQDTDGDGLDDFSEVRVGWEIGVQGSALRRVFPDPRLTDSDRDRLGDREEQDMRRVQCECVGGPDDGEACTRDIPLAADEEREACRTGASACMNVADSPVTPCSTILTANRLDPRRRDTDDDLVSDSDEVVGWLTQAAVIDPKNVIIAGADREADTRACPSDVCMGGSNDGEPCRYQRDCPPQMQCEGGINNGDDCTNDIDCRGPTPATSGLCNDSGATHVCNRTGCDDVQVVEVGAVGENQRAVVVAPGPNGLLETTAAIDDLEVAAGDLRAQTNALTDDQQIALVDPARILADTPLGRTIIRPGVDGEVDSLPAGDDVVADGQYRKTTDPLKPDTDNDLIFEGLERILGSDPRDPTDGGFLADRDGDGLTDGQEELVGWIVTVGGSSMDVHSNPNAPDSDLDGLPDYVEFALRLDPNGEDTDSDGLADFDELSEEQFDAFEVFNGFFQSFSLVGDDSAMYGTDPVNCDTDGDDLTDHFELLVGWSVRVPTDTGVVVYPVFSDPTNADTDFDGLNDGGEYKHTFNGSPAPATDPTDFDSDGDGRLDGEECNNIAAALAACTNPTTESLAACLSNPLVPDKRVTIRYTQLTVDRGQNDGAGTVDMAWRFQAQKSTEPYPGSWYGVRTDRPICVAVGNDAWCYQGGYCSVPEGTDFIFQGPHCQWHGNACNPNGVNTCPSVGHCEFIPFIQCTADSHCPFNFLGEDCVGLVQDNCLTGNEITFSLQPGEGILLNGEASQYNDCRGAECTSGPNVGQLCDPFNFEVGCCPKKCNNTGASCTVDGNCTVCSGGPSSGDACNPLSFAGTCCPKFCTGTSNSCSDDDDCEDDETCDFDCTGITCAAPAGSCEFDCGIITCEAPFADNHVIYVKSLSYETLQDGFSVDVARLTDANDAQQFSLTLIVEIIVE